MGARMFHCRENELGDMNRRYSKGNFECLIVYGRRRVGKTALINEFCRDKPTVFFSALNASDKENLEALSKAIYEKDHPGSDSAPVYQSFDAAFGEITRMAEKERLVFVIDEYPYLAKASRSISSRLQHIIDRTWKNGRLYLILCGSSMRFMEYQVLGYESPLYGRRTGQYRIRALSYDEITAFNPALSAEQQALVYGVTGGIPHYINKLDVSDDVDAALKQNLFNTSSYLYEEPENLLKQELREPAIYNSIIAAIAGGAARSNEISTKVGIESAICAKYLKVLLNLGIVRKESPMTEKPGKKTIYTIGDSFFRFWYRFVPQSASAIGAGRIEQIYEPMIKRHFPEYMALVFEQMCREYLLRRAENLPILLADVGQWWGTDPVAKKEAQIDIVGAPAEGEEYIIGSCKFRNEPVGTDELDLIRHYAHVFGKGKRYHYYIFSKSGFTAGLKSLEERGDVRLVALEDMYR